MVLKLSCRAIQIASASLLLCVFAIQGHSAEIDRNIIDMIEDPMVLTQGEKLYQQTCASCHSRDLSGATGFNLKDGEWIHGNKPSQILNNIKNGFMKAGMPGFAEVYAEQQLSSVVAYILSKRQGFDGLTYKIYQMKDKLDRQIAEDKLIKSGKVASNVADYALPEIQDYVIVFEGDFYTPKDEDTKVWVQWGKPLEINIDVNGRRIERVGQWNPTWELARGRQRLKITYYSGNNKPKQRNISLIVTNVDMSIKLFPISEKGRSVLADNKIELKATGKTLVQRKKIVKIPTYSISVGLPSKMNYAFNTRSCSIVGIWQGDMLNVGPNVNGRGQDGSLPLGFWLFHSPTSLHHEESDKATCRFKGYKMVNDEPVFTYMIGAIEYVLFASSNYQGQLSFHYKSKNLSQSSLALSLPEIKDFKWVTDAKTVTGNQVKISSDRQGMFTVSVQNNN